MAKAKKKPAKEASNLFHNIMAASVKGNPKPASINRKGNYSLPVEEMDLPQKLKIILKENNISNLKELAKLEAFELLQFKNLGIKSIVLIEKLLGKYGLNLGDNIN